MPKTYNTLSNVTVGSVLTASDYNESVENSNNFRVPPNVRAYRATDQTSYTSAASITWTAEAYDTDGMFAASSTNITVQTSGLYLITFQGLWTATATVAEYEPIVSVAGNSTLRVFDKAPSTTAARFNISGVVALTASQVVTASISFAGGSAYVIKGGTDPRSDTTSLSLAWLGQVS